MIPMPSAAQIKKCMCGDTMRIIVENARGVWRSCPHCDTVCTVSGLRCARCNNAKQART